MKKVSLILMFLFSLVIPLRSVIFGGFPFWFDPARDLLLALDNLKKLTLIGPPTGIPGLFYGPYWIWLLSVPLSFSRDPRWVIMLILTIPYLVIFPLLLWQFKKNFGVKITICLWLLFIFGFGQYATFLWNPHLAPLLFLFLAFLIYKNNPKTILVIGITAGLILNFHFSFGMASIFGSLLFIILTRSIKKIIIFSLGIGVTLLPFVIFESRHGFNQSGAFFHAFTNAMFYNSAVVGQIGLSKLGIFNMFQQTLATLLHVPSFILPILEIPTIVWLIGQIYKRKLYFESNEKRLLKFLSFVLIGILYLFFSSKNPIWDYHFIGIETIFLLILGSICIKSQFLSRLLMIWTFLLLVLNVFNFIKSPQPNYLTIQSFQSKKTIVEYVVQDANNSDYIAYSYNPALYTYDYDYLFLWLEPKQNNVRNSEYIYLIIPESPLSVVTDFVHYRTPDKKFTTISWIQAPDKTLIIKRKLNPNSL